MRLEPGEQVMVRTRTHPRALLRPAAVLVAVAFPVSYTHLTLPTNREV